MRFLALVLLAGCAHEAPPPSRRAHDPVLDESMTHAPPPPRPLAERYETRRIGEEPAAVRVVGDGGLVDIDVKDADVHDVLRLLADVGKVNIVVGDNVSGRVTMQLRRVPWRQALDAVTSTKGLAVSGEGSVLIITAAAK